MAEHFEIIYGGISAFYLLLITSFQEVTVKDLVRKVWPYITVFMAVMVFHPFSKIYLL